MTWTADQQNEFIENASRQYDMTDDEVAEVHRIAGDSWYLADYAINHVVAARDCPTKHAKAVEFGMYAAGRTDIAICECADCGELAVFRIRYEKDAGE